MEFQISQKTQAEKFISVGKMATKLCAQWQQLKYIWQILMDDKTGSHSEHNTPYQLKLPCAPAFCPPTAAPLLLLQILAD